jgi:anaerobic ribonucleoside-triphosphate reductase activating protein
MTVDQLIEIIKRNDFDVTFSGGDPVYQAEALLPLVKEIAKCGYTMWLYTGFTYEQLQTMPQMAEILLLLEAVVDGPFVESLRDTDLIFRGSSNQRIVYTK